MWILDGWVKHRAVRPLEACSKGLLVWAFSAGIGFSWALAIEGISPPARCSGRAVISRLTDVEEKYLDSNPIAAVKRYTDHQIFVWLYLWWLLFFCFYVSL